jgi:benzoyl-CoA reductase subunit C
MTGRLGALVEQVQELYEDVDFRSVHRWKEAHPGRKAIGYMPIYVPRELIHAAGMLPVGVLGGGDQLEIIRGDAFFQSYICHIPRSTIELAVSGRLDVLDGMLFPSICDVIRNLSGMWSILFPDRYVRYVDVPQNYDSSVGGAFYSRELQALRRDLEALSGHRVTDEALRESIGLYNENRKALADLYTARSAQPWVFPTSEMYLFVRSGCVLPPEEHTALLRQYLELAPLEADRVERDHSRIVVRGMFCEQPPLGLLHTLERAGCWIVDDDLVLGLRWLESDVPIAGDPLQNLCTAFLQCSTATASRYLPERRKGEALLNGLRKHRAEGVVLCAPSFCDPALLDQPMLTAALDRAGVAHTQFKYAENTGQFAGIREQAGTFSDSIRLWSDT